MEASFRYNRSPIVIKTFLSILIPTILMNLTTAIGSMADAVIIGQYLDELSLSVVTYATPIYMIINTIAALFAVGGCIAMSVDTGKGEKRAANRSFSVSMECLALLAAILLTAGILFSGKITCWLGAGSAEVFEQVRTYVQIILIGAPVFVMNIAIAFFVRNDGSPTLSMVGMLLSIAVDIIFNLVFVGMMNMGVAGAAYSTVLGQAVSIVVISSHFFSTKNTLRFFFAFDLSVFRIIKNGIGSALTFVYQFVTIIILNHYVVLMAGANGVVIYTVVFNLCTVSLAVFEGLSQTIQPMVSVYYGENSNKKIKGSVKLAVLSAIVICSSVMLVLELFPQIVPWLFGIEEIGLIEQASLAVRIYTVSMLIMTVNVIIGYYLQSIEMGSMASGLISLRCCILFLASMFVLGSLFGLNGIWAAYFVAEFLTFVVFVIWNFAKRKKLAKEGKDADVFFLDKNVEKSTCSLVFSKSRGDYDHFQNEVKLRMAQDGNFCEPLMEMVSSYLVKLQPVAEEKKKQYIEVEMNSFYHKMIIRDNVNHAAVQDEFGQLCQGGTEAEYSPVLGWNRLYIKGVEGNE